MVARRRDEAVLVVHIWHDAGRHGLRIRIVEVAQSHRDDDLLAAASVEAALSEIRRRLLAFDARATVPDRLS
jgi:hypothetical protein